MIVKIDEKLVISFDEYCKKFLTNDWNNYWDDVLKPLYEIEYWKIINKNNVKNLLEDIFEQFDFERVEKYMKSVNWTWNDRSSTPTIKELKSCVLNLVSEIVDKNKIIHNPSTISTGGFSVSLYFINNIPSKIKIEFSKNDGTKITKKTDLSIIRKKKLEKINEYRK